MGDPENRHADNRPTPLERVLRRIMRGPDQAAGLAALVSCLRSGGLARDVESWISTGPNERALPGDIERALGETETAALSRETGLLRDELLEALSLLLPVIVDKLTPDGHLPGREEDMPLGALATLFGGSSRNSAEPGALGAVQGGEDAPPEAGATARGGPAAQYGGVGGHASREAGRGAGGDAGIPRLDGSLPPDDRGPGEGRDEGLPQGRTPSRG